MYPVESLAKECQQVLTNKEKRQRRPVSRVLSPGSVARPGETVISLGRRLPGASSSHTRERHAGRASPTLASEIALLFGFAPGGVYRADPVTRAAGELLPHRFTLTAAEPGPAEAVYFLLRYPWPCGRWALPTTPSFGARTFLPGRNAYNRIAPERPSGTPGTHQ